MCTFASRNLKQKNNDNDEKNIVFRLHHAYITKHRNNSKGEVVEMAGVMPNPTIEKVLEGAHTARQENVDFILGVGGGSTVDYCKAVAGSAWYDGDPWEYYFKNWQPMTCRWIPVGCVLTMAGTGSEMDSCSVISSHSENRKLFYNFRNPDFSILNPRFTFTVPKYQMVAGIYDSISRAPTTTPATTLQRG